jgi:hypothetical protein
MWQSRKPPASLAEQIPAHLRQRYSHLLALPANQLTPPWRMVASVAVGGLSGVGFEENSDTLLVTSFAGRGVFDGLTGERLARDDAYPFPEDTANCQVEGIGPLASRWVRTAGHHGGGLAAWADGWSVERLPLTWPNEHLLLFPNGNSLWDDRQNLDGVMKFLPDVLVAFGFSPTGRTFIVATSSDFTLYGR